MSNKRDSKGKFVQQDPPRSRVLEATLRQIYYDPQHVASFGSPYLLYQAAKSKVRNLKVSDVEGWLSHQRTYALHRDNATNFVRRKVLVPGPGHQYQADLMDVARWSSPANSATHYLLTIIDCFSRLAAVVPMKFKTGRITAAALARGFKDMGKDPRKLQTDNGKEFYNKWVNQMLKRKKIIHFSTFQHDTKAQMVERFNRTLRSKIEKYKTAFKTDVYVPALSKLVAAYNKRKHSAFKHKYAPLEVNMTNRKEVFKILYGDYLKSARPTFKLQIGDRVLLARDKKTTIRDRSLSMFHPTPYEVVDRLATKPPTYKIKNAESDVVHEGTFYTEQLHLIQNRQDLTT